MFRAIADPNECAFELVEAAPEAADEGAAAAAMEAAPARICADTRALFSISSWVCTHDGPHARDTEYAEVRTVNAHLTQQ